MNALKAYAEPASLPATEPRRLARFLNLDDAEHLDEVAFARRVAEGLPMTAVAALGELVGRSRLEGRVASEATLHRHRIGDSQGRWPVYSADGARQVAGRWHDVGDRVIYASEQYSTAMLEMLARWNGPPPGSQHFGEIRIPVGTSYEVAQVDALPDWHPRPSSSLLPVSVPPSSLSTLTPCPLFRP